MKNKKYNKNKVVNNVIIYTRVSTTEQATKGYSLNSQEEACKTYAINNNLNVVKLFKECGESAKTIQRTKLKELISFCAKNKKNIDAILVWKLDRLTRCMSDFYTLNNMFNEFGIEILSATENNDNSATGKLTRNMLGAFAQFENDQKSERVEAGMIQAFNEGKWLWKPPYGYKMFDGEMVIDNQTAPIVKKIYELYATGLYKQTDICRMLARENINISSAKIHYILNQILYTGYMFKPEWNSELVKCSAPAIINKDLYYKTQSILNNKNNQVTSYVRNNPQFPLRRFIVCPFCGSPLTASNSKSKNKKKYAYYHCYNKKCNNQIRIPKNKLENMFIEQLQNIIPNKTICDNLKEKIIENYKIMMKESIEKEKRLKTELKKIEDKKNKILDLYIDGKLNENDYNYKSEEYNKQIINIKSELASYNDNNNVEDCIEFVFESLNKLDEIWLNSDIDTKQKLQQLIFPEGLIYEENGFRTTQNDSVFTKKGAFIAPDLKMVPPSEFESLSTP